MTRWSADLLEGCRPLDFGNLPLLPPLDPRSAGVQGVVRCRVVVLLTLGGGRHAARAQTTELRRHTNWEEESSGISSDGSFPQKELPADGDEEYL